MCGKHIFQVVWAAFVCGKHGLSKGESPRYEAGYADVYGDMRYPISKHLLFYVGRFLGVRACVRVCKHLVRARTFGCVGIVCMCVFVYERHPVPKESPKDRTGGVRSVEPN